MYSVSTQELRNAAGNLASQAKDFINSTGHDLYDVTNKWAKQARNAYPSIASQARDAANQTVRQSRGWLDSAGTGLHSAAHGFACTARSVEGYALKLGAGYLAIKLFTSKDNEMSSACRKVKQHVEDRPVESAAIALGVGYLLGKLLR